MKMASFLNLSSPFSLFFKNFYKTLASNNLRRIISWLFVVYPLPSRLRPRVEGCQPHRAAGLLCLFGLDVVDKNRVASLGNRLETLEIRVTASLILTV